MTAPTYYTVNVDGLDYREAGRRSSPVLLLQWVF